MSHKDDFEILRDAVEELKDDAGDEFTEGVEDAIDRIETALNDAHRSLVTVVKEDGVVVSRQANRIRELESIIRAHWSPSQAEKILYGNGSLERAENEGWRISLGDDGIS